MVFLLYMLSKSNQAFILVTVFARFICEFGIYGAGFQQTKILCHYCHAKKKELTSIRRKIKSFFLSFTDFESST